MGLSSLLYSVGLGAYHLGIKIAAPFNAKAQLWVKGRKDWQDNLQAALTGKPLVWVHCASLGEYEQGRPVIEALERQFPEKQVLVSFYSPSGYEVVKDREPNRTIVYLPADTTENAKRFLQIANPTLAIFIKYEFWYHYLQQLKHHKVPTLLVSGIFRPSQPFFKQWGGLHREMLTCFSHFFVQDLDSSQLLSDLGFRNITISGDTRFDRVVALQLAPKELLVIEQFKAGRAVMVAGSTWPADEKILEPLLPVLLANGWKVIIAPHDIDAHHIRLLSTDLGSKAITYSQALKDDAADKDVLIIDNVGLLSYIYHYGELAYIGGGMGKGIHNILEAAASGLPVVFGPNYLKFKEAVDLVNLGGAFSVSSFETLKKQIDLLQDEEQYLNAAATCQKYVADNVGATSKVLNWIKEQVCLSDTTK
jgi:3-deoxy-D-manno-octulosonic-acid transferase